MVTRRHFLQAAGALTALGSLGARTAVAAAEAAAPPAPRGHAYVPTTDPLVRRKLAAWSDWKFGLILHFGLYSQLGIVESWSICSEDEPFCKRPDGVGYVAWKQRYENLRKTFDPTRLDPAHWAAAAYAAGMRYVVFTTKHHDGFCLFDTATTDYRSTAADVPFHADPRANITRAVFDAFRSKGFGIGAYFSKADWHHPDYWSPLWATPTRNNNYNVDKHPELWRRFVEFTQLQVNELTSQYGRVDLLWLDAGWVGGHFNPNARAYSSSVPWSQDIDMPRMAATARRNQPGLIMVNRDEGGPYEDYRTPEQTVPDHPLPYPWETVMTMGDSWSWKPDDNYKSPRALVHLLAGIVAKGGNLLLGVGPKGDGELPAVALERLAAIGKWMDVNGTAIHATRPVAPYSAGKFRYTRTHAGAVNAIYLTADDEPELPAELEVPGLQPAANASLRVLGQPERLTWKPGTQGVRVSLPAALRQRLRGTLAWVLQVSPTA